MVLDHAKTQDVLVIRNSEQADQRVLVRELKYLPRYGFLYNGRALNNLTHLIRKFNLAESIDVIPKLKTHNRVFHCDYLALRLICNIADGSQSDRIVAEISAVPNIELHVKACDLPYN